MTDLVFVWGMAAGGILLGALWNWRAGVQRRKLRAAERRIVELEHRNEELWKTMEGGGE